MYSTLKEKENRATLYRLQGKDSKHQPYHDANVKLSNTDFKVAVVTMFREVRVNTLETHGRIAVFYKKMTAVEKEPNENFRTEKYNRNKIFTVGPQRR